MEGNYEQIDESGQEKKMNICQKCFRKSIDRITNMKRRTLVLLIVFIALLLDNILLTVIVPIIPDYLWILDHKGPLQKSCGNTSHGNPDEVNWSNFLSRRPTFPPHQPDLKNCVEQYLIINNKTGMEAETLKIGLMLASKPVIQLLTNPFIGPLTNRIGYTIPIFTGLVVMFVSTLVFAFAGSYAVLFIARAFQGIGSSCSSVAGMGMLATFYPDDTERGEAFGFALSGLALGVLIGPSLGGVLYEYTTKEMPFIILAGFVLLDGILQLCVFRPKYSPEAEEGVSLKTLMTDPYIVLAAAAITVANMSIGILEPSLPIWIKQTMGASRLEQGLIFLPFSISYLISTNVIGSFGHKIGRWLATLLGLLLIGIFLFVIPQSQTIPQILFPGVMIGFAIGMVDGSVLPIMGYLVDIRHTSVYGSVYAITDVAFCLGFAIGPALSGTLIELLNFKWMSYIIGIMCLVFAPFIYFLKSPPEINRQPEKVDYIQDNVPDQYKAETKHLDTSNSESEYIKEGYGY